MLDAALSLAACPLRKESMRMPQGKQVLSMGKSCRCDDYYPRPHCMHANAPTVLFQVRSVRPAASQLQAQGVMRNLPFPPLGNSIAHSRVLLPDRFQTFSVSSFNAQTVQNGCNQRGRTASPQRVALDSTQGAGVTLFQQHVALEAKGSTDCTSQIFTAAGLPHTAAPSN